MVSINEEKKKENFSVEKGFFAAHSSFLSNMAAFCYM